MAPRAAVIALLLVPLLAGCIEIEADDIDLNMKDDAPKNGATEVPPTPAEAPPETRSTIPLIENLTLRDARPDPLAPNGSVVINASFSMSRPLPDGAVLHITHGVDDEETAEEDSPTRIGKPTVHSTWTHELAPGPHTIHFAVGYRPAPDAPVTVLNNTTIDLVVMDGLTIVLDAEKEWYAGQKTFRTELTVPFAPWAKESAYDLLARGADRTGFTFQATYDSALASYYIQAINGTEETWATGNTWSHSWMVHLDGKDTRSAVDDTYPKPDQTLSFRYLKCYTTGRCTDGEV